MIRSYLPRWKFTDSCGHPRAPSAINLGCAHSGRVAHHHATRRYLLKAGVAIAGAAGLATILDPREDLAGPRLPAAAARGEPDPRPHGYPRALRARRLWPVVRRR